MARITSSNSYNRDIPLTNIPEYAQWQKLGNEARDYISSVRPQFSIRDQNADFSFNLRHGLLPAPLPPSHAEIVPESASASKMANEIMTRILAILTAVYPKWIFHPAGLSESAGLLASKLATWSRSLWLGIEDAIGLPIIRLFVDQQLASGGAFFKVHPRLDRWGNLPLQIPDESDREYQTNLRDWKMRHLPFDITVPEYRNCYYDLTVDGITCLIEHKRITAHDAASEFGGHYNTQKKQLILPIEIGNPNYGVDEFEPETVTRDLTINAERELDYYEYWKRGEYCVYMIDNHVIRVDYLDPDMPIPYFLALGEVTSSPDPGRMGLPLMYNAFETFMRKLGLMGMEYAFLYKHGFARMFRTRKRPSTPATEEPLLPDQEEEEELIGELIEGEIGEDMKYITPANVSALFADAKNEIDKEIQNVALADVLTGRLPPAGTTGYLMSQLAAAAVSKYIPILHQCARAIRLATLYMIDTIDREFESEVVVAVQQNEKSEGAWVSYRPKESKGSRNLEVQINAPLPSDQIQKTQWLMQGHATGYLSKERVQREGFLIEQPELENQKVLLDKFDEFYMPIAMMKALRRAGQVDELLQAAQSGLLPPELAALAAKFAAGPEGLAAAGQPVTGGSALPVVGPNPNGVIAPRPGLGQSGIPTVGATANAQPQYGNIGAGGGGPVSNV